MQEKWRTKARSTGRSIRPLAEPVEKFKIKNEMIPSEKLDLKFEKLWAKTQKRKLIKLGFE